MQNPGRIAHDDDARRDVLDDDGRGADERLLADLDCRAEHGSRADPRPAPDRGAFTQGVPLLGSAHEVVVRGDHTRGDEHLVLDR